MPIQIDRMDTSVEIAAPVAAVSGERRAMPASDPAAQDALRDVVGKLMADELERFVRNRGL
jgi:regulator of protease activity HflC (stomatin/prohibitin superfamily)